MHVNLRNAYLCADCDAISDSPVQCPACASRLGILPLITVLNRTQKATLVPKDLTHMEVFGVDGYLEWLCKPPQRCIGSLKGVDVYQTDRQADAEAIVRILEEIEPTMRENPLAEEECILCFNPLTDHGESCPFRMADEFIAKYGTHPPAEPRRV